MSNTFRIERLGAQGDGIAATETGQVFIRYTLPGETVTAARVKDRAELLAVVEASPQRVEPACRHFGTCGGCAVQHLEDAAYLDWKRDKVVSALKSAGVAAEVAPIVTCAPGARRRVVLAARRVEKGALLGYYTAMSHRIVDIEECPIAEPAIVARLPELRRLAGMVSAGSEPFRMGVTHTAGGLDIAVEGGGKLKDAERLKAGAAALDVGFARLSLDGEIIVEGRKPTVAFGTANVESPPGAFLQATQAAEDAMAGLVLAHLDRAKTVADLFCGTGMFALRLAARATVHAVEAEAAPLAALDRGFRAAGGALRKVTTEKRDLFRRPLLPRDLDRFDGLVFDPPRAGAEDQCKQLARSTVPWVAAVSCNPATLGRDLAILVEGGYRVASVTPIDQFLWSPHVEAVALLEKPRRRR